jgi:two-component system cell cycle sensor histidine kinase/response regulator CckA
MTPSPQDAGGGPAAQSSHAASEKVEIGDLPLPAYVWRIVDGRLTFVGANHLAREIEPALDRFVGLTIDDLETRNPELGGFIREALDEQTAVLGEVAYHREIGGAPRRLSCACVYVGERTVIVYATDATERREVERSLREANARFRAAFERSPLGMALISVEPETAGRMIEVNDAFCELFGFARRELIGRVAPVELNHPDDVGIGLDEVARLVAGDIAFCQIEKRFVRSDGTPMDTILRMSLVDRPDGGERFALCQFEDVTERERADAALRESEARYRQIVETTSEGVWMIDADNRTMFVNARMAEMLGYTPDEMLGTTPDQYTIDGKMPPINEKLARRRQGVPEQHEDRLRRRDGSALWVSISNDSLPAPDGSYTGALAMMSDITERKRAEGELKEAKLRFEGAFEQAPIGMALVNLEEPGFGELLLVNSALAALLGYEEHELVGRTITELTHPEDVTQNLGLARSLVEGRTTSYEVTKRFVRKAGDVVLANMNASVVRGEDGTLLYGIAHIQDITARRRAEDELEERERRFRAAFAFAQDAMLIADDERVWTEGNQAAAELLGIPVEEIPGHRLDEFAASPPEDVAATWQAFLDRGELTGEFQIRRRDGEIRDVDFGATANFTPGRHLSIIRDVTERKRAQADAEMLEAALHQTQKLETVGQLAGGVAHDFNNVLAVILNSSEFALSQLGDHPAAEDVRAMREAAERAAALTRQLLVFSRREIARPQLLPLNGLVSSIERLLRRTIGEHIKLVVVLEDDLPPIEADPSHVEQVLLNLAVNARDAMPDGGTLRVETRSVTIDNEYARLKPDMAAGRYVLLAVSDTGCGMPEPVLQRAFDPFFTTKPKGSGTGLGLATAYGIVKQNGGHIALYSEPGEGTVAKVYLPAAAKAAVASGELAAAAPPTGNGELVLLVEDEDAVRRVTERILTTNGYEVVSAGNPLDALKLAEETEIDMVLTDVVMPELTGGQLVEQLRDGRPGMPAVFMSGYTDRPGSLPSDAGFVSKPFSSRTLLEQVAGKLKGSA